jgi:hypothetical protein
MECFVEGSEQRLIFGRTRADISIDDFPLGLPSRLHHWITRSHLQLNYSHSRISTPTDLASQLPLNRGRIQKRPHLLDPAVAKPVKDMFGEMHHLARRLASEELLLRRAVEPDARGHAVIGREQHFHIEMEIRGRGEAGFDHGFVLGKCHASAVVGDVFVHERGEGRVGIYGSDVGVVVGFQGCTRHLGGSG